MFAFALAHWNHIAAVAVVALVGLKFANSAGLFKGLKWPVFGKAGPDDAGDFAALAKLRKRFDAAKCSEGVAACDVLLTHFFHGGE